MKLIVVLIGLLFLGCNNVQKPEINELKTEILGGLVLGESISHNLALIESQRLQKKIRVVEKNIPFYHLQDENNPTHSDYFLFPNLQYSDTFITRVEYYAYGINKAWAVGLSNPGLVPTNEFYNTEYLIQKKNEEERWGNEVITGFSLSSKGDSETGISFPNIPGKDDFRNKVLFDYLDKEIQSKYGKETSENKVGQTSVVNPPYKRTKIWNTDLLKISLTMQRYDMNNYTTVLVYEYNEDTRQKYQLEKLSNKVQF